MKKILLLTAATLLAAATASAQANTVAYNQNVAADGSNNLFFGNTIANGAFTTDSNNGALIGLRADTRFLGAITPVDSTPGVTNLYLSTAGGGSAALWDFTYSIDLSVAADHNLADYIATISITGPTGPLNSFNALLIPDNDQNTVTHVTNTAELTAGVAQNAENIGFGFIGGNPNVPGLYTINLALTTQAGVAVASDQIFVNAAPLPSAATMGLGMLALLGAAGMIRSKLRTA